MEWGYIDCSTLPLDKLLPQFTKLLSSVQKAHAASFKTPGLRNFYIIRQGIMLAILAHKLNTTPEKIELAYSRYKKPYIATTPSLHFNTATTKSRLFMVALSSHGPCGVDIETIKLKPAHALSNSELLSLAEQSAFASLPPAQQVIALYNSWVQKEAYLKALGTGFYTAPETLEVPVIGTLPRIWPDSNLSCCFEGYELRLSLIQPDVVACLATTNSDLTPLNFLNIKTILEDTSLL